MRQASTGGNWQSCGHAWSVSRNGKRSWQRHVWRRRFLAPRLQPPERRSGRRSRRCSSAEERAALNPPSGGPAYPPGLSPALKTRAARSGVRWKRRLIRRNGPRRWPMRRPRTASPPAGRSCAAPSTHMSALSSALVALDLSRVAEQTWPGFKLLINSVACPFLRSGFFRSVAHCGQATTFLDARTSLRRGWSRMSHSIRRGGEAG